MVVAHKKGGTGSGAANRQGGGWRGSVRAVDARNDEVVAVRDGLGEALVRGEGDAEFPVVVGMVDGDLIVGHLAEVFDGFPFEVVGAEFPFGPDLDDAESGFPGGFGALVEAFVPEAVPREVLVVVDAKGDGEGSGVEAGFFGRRRHVGGRFVEVGGTAGMQQKEGGDEDRLDGGFLDLCHDCMDLVKKCHQIYETDDLLDIASMLL